VSNNNGPLRVILNNDHAARPWLGLRLMTGKRDAYGARVEVKRKDATTLWRRVRADGSYPVGERPSYPARTGASPSIEKLTVHWPGGRSERFPVPALGRYTTLVEGTGRSEADR